MSHVQAKYTSDGGEVEIDFTATDTGDAIVDVSITGIKLFGVVRDLAMISDETKAAAIEYCDYGLWE